MRAEHFAKFGSLNEIWDLARFEQTRVEVLRREHLSPTPYICQNRVKALCQPPGDQRTLELPGYVTSGSMCEHAGLFV